MWSSSQASSRGVVEMGRVEAGPSHFPKRPAPRNPARYTHPFLPNFYFTLVLHALVILSVLMLMGKGQICSCFSSSVKLVNQRPINSAAAVVVAVQISYGVFFFT
jgi:hypothetical protein